MITVTITVIFTVIRSPGSLGLLVVDSWLVGHWRAELLALHGVGPIAIERLRPALAALGLAFAGE